MRHHIPTDSPADKLRMLIWLLVGVMLYAASYMLGTDNPVPQVACQKLGNVATFSWLGYWIARMSLGRIDFKSSAGDKQARAIVMGAAIIAGALGL